MQAEVEPELLYSQALVVTSGPFAGRICINDDDEWLERSDLEDLHFDWILNEDLQWRTVHFTAEETEGEPRTTKVIDCEIVTFGYYLVSHGHYYIPRQLLRPATMKDLIERHEEISDALGRAAFKVGKKPPMRELYSLLLEQQMVSDEIRERDIALREPSEARNLFLCHASVDKYYVRRVAADLVRAGHAVWFDEFEIKVGESIVEKINQGTQSANALIFFVSKDALKSEWVKREWNSTLSRALSGAGVRVLPALLDEAELPAIISDIKYADFRKSYEIGLTALIDAVGALPAK